LTLKERGKKHERGPGNGIIFHWSRLRFKCEEKGTKRKKGSCREVKKAVTGLEGVGTHVACGKIKDGVEAQCKRPHQDFSKLADNAGALSKRRERYGRAKKRGRGKGKRPSEPKGLGKREIPLVSDSIQRIK